MRWLLAIPVVGAIVGWVVAALINENCPTGFFARTCNRAKPVHLTVIGFAVGVGVLMVGYVLARIFAAAARAARGLRGRPPQD